MPDVKQVTVLTDSVACLNHELIERYDIGIVPINFYAGGRLYRDWVDVTPSQAYELFLKDPESFKTSTPSLEEFVQAFQAASKKAPNIVFISLSARLSSTYSAVLRAKDMAQERLRGVTIEVVDSAQATPSEGFVALAAARAADAGKSLKEAVQAAEDIRSRVNAIILLDTIQHVYRSGRIPKIASQIGSVLNVRPILTISGTVHFAGAVRNHHHGIERILNLMEKKARDRPVHVSVFHAYAPEEAQVLKEAIAAKFNCVELWTSEFSPVMGYACGTGTVGMAFYTEE